MGFLSISLQTNLNGVAPKQHLLKSSKMAWLDSSRTPRQLGPKASTNHVPCVRSVLGSLKTTFGLEAASFETILLFLVGVAMGLRALCASVFFSRLIQH